MILVCAAVIVATMGPSAEGQAVTTAVFTPDVVAPGEPWTLTISGCDDPGDEVAALAMLQFSDTGGSLIAERQPDGTFVASGSAPREDLIVLRTHPCEMPDGTQVILDVENPQLVLAPIPAYRPTSVIGTDCPDGATPTASVTSAGRTIELDPGPVDERGDWSADLPDPNPETVYATCGAMTYKTIAFAAPATTTTTTTTTASDLGGTAPAEGAVPVVAGASFTG
jgi:hypothetical protein